MQAEDDNPVQSDAVCATTGCTSASGDLLRLADPTWQARVANGIDWMLWSSAGLLIFAVLDYLPRLQPVIPVLNFVAQLVGFYGVWQCTAPEPRRFESGHAARRLARWAAATWLVLQSVGWLLAEGPLASFVSDCCGWCAGSIANVAALAILARLAARIPSERLTQQIVTFAWFYAIGSAAIMAEALAEWVCYLLGAQSLPANGFLRDASNFARVLGPVLLIALPVVLFAVSRKFTATVGLPQDAERVEQGRELVR